MLDYRSYWEGSNMTKELEKDELSDATSRTERVETKVVASKPGEPPPPAPKKRGLFRWVALLAVIAAVTGIVMWWLDARHYESTDDAQVDGHLDSVSARISGVVTYINPKVENNQYIEA